MLRVTELKLPLDHAAGDLANAVRDVLSIEADALVGCTVARRAYDARRKSAISLVYTVDAELQDEAGVLARHSGDPRIAPTPDIGYRLAAHAPAGLTCRPVVIGAGPCGLFAGLLLAQMGFRPIILERGRMVRPRTRDTWALWRRGVLDPASNVQFGEGGAGTFSDGKLYSQIKDPQHLGRKVLEEFVRAGAPAEILYEAKPHIGTFRLVGMVEAMRASIEALGGEYRFETQVSDLDIAETPNGSAACAGWCCRTAAILPPGMSCWRSAIARATPSRCCTRAACGWTPSRSPSACASNIRNR